MGRTVRASGSVAIALLGLFTSGAWAGPLLSTGTYDVTLPGGGHYLVSGTVEQQSGGFLYTYTVTNLDTSGERAFELGLKADPSVQDNYTDTNAQVSPGTGTLFHDVSPF